MPDAATRQPQLRGAGVLALAGLGSGVLYGLASKNLLRSDWLIPFVQPWQVEILLIQCPSSCHTVWSPGDTTVDVMRARVLVCRRDMPSTAE